MHALAEQPPLPPVEDVDADERIRAFVAGEYRQVVATVALVCGSTATAEDAVQEALARAWEQTARGNEIDRLGAWVTTVALNLARSQMRRWRSERRARTKLGALRPEIHDVTGATGDAYAVRQALLDLPRRRARGHGAALLPRPGRPGHRRTSRDRRGHREGDALPSPAEPGGRARRRRPGPGARPCRCVRSSSRARCARPRRA